MVSVPHLSHTVWAAPVSWRDGGQGRVQTEDVIASLTGIADQQLLLEISTLADCTLHVINVLGKGMVADNIIISNTQG